MGVMSDLDLQLRGMGTLILALPAETPQQSADELLRIWQEQRKQGLKPDQRSLPDDNFNRDLEIIKQCMERS